MAEAPRRSRITLGLMLAATLLTLAVGYAVKRPCLVGPWDGRQYRQLCYSDVAGLYEAEGLDRDLVPYLEVTNEYPVLTGFTMLLGAVPAESFASFFNWTAGLLALAALGTAAMLHRLARERAPLFAFAPTLAAYAFMNWDLVAVVLATGAMLAYRRRQDASAGALLGLGAAAKLYPALLILPLALGRLRQRRTDGAVRLTGAAIGAWLVVNLPIAILAPEAWSYFFRFNSTRPADWDSLWYLAQRHGLPISTTVVNVLSAVAFVGVSALVWKVVSSRNPRFRAWTFGFPLLVAFLLAGKVYSPQFSLWLLPWFVLALPNWRLFLLFSVTDVAVFVTRFQFFAELQGVGGVPFGWFEAAIIARALVLVICLVAWVRHHAPRTAPVPRPVEAPA
ncbi:MAG: glycosyltransferase 87 family protein [Actinomycetota bacterium]